MSNNPIKVALDDRVVPIDTSPAMVDFAGLYFQNLNRDRSVRIIASRPVALSKDNALSNNNRTIESLDANTVGFCLTPRPALEISCDGATSDFAVQLKGGKTYKVVVDGQVISTAATVQQLAQLMQPYAVETTYLRLPRQFQCSTYTAINTINIPLTTNGTTADIKLTLTPTSGNPIVLDFTTASSLINYNGKTLFVTLKTLSDNPSVQIISVDLSQLIDDVTVDYKIECKSLTTNVSVLSLVELLTRSTDATIDRTEKFYPTIDSGNGYWCVKLRTATGAPI